MGRETLQPGPLQAAGDVGFNEVALNSLQTRGNFVVADAELVDALGLLKRESAEQVIDDARQAVALRRHHLVETNTEKDVMIVVPVTARSAPGWCGCGGPDRQCVGAQAEPFRERLPTSRDRFVRRPVVVQDQVAIGGAQALQAGVKICEQNFSAFVVEGRCTAGAVYSSSERVNMSSPLRLLE